MKKLLLIIPILALLAGACIQPQPKKDQPASNQTSQAKPEEHSNSNKTLTTQGNISARVLTRGDENVILLTQNGQETVVDSGPNDSKNPDEYLAALGTKSFYLIKFSPTGNYLEYEVGGYENSELKVYDVKNKKIVFKNDGGGHGEFNPKETLYFFCNLNDFNGNTEAKIYQLPGFKIQLDLLKQFAELKGYAFSKISCDVNTETNLVNFNFQANYLSNTSVKTDLNKIYKVDLSSGKLLN